MIFFHLSNLNLTFPFSKSSQKDATSDTDRFTRENLNSGKLEGKKSMVSNHSTGNLYKTTCFSQRYNEFISLLKTKLCYS